jgi:hypothetical protein
MSTLLTFEEQCGEKVKENRNGSLGRNGSYFVSRLLTVRRSLMAWLNYPSIEGITASTRVAFGTFT